MVAAAPRSLDQSRSFLSRFKERVKDAADQDPGGRYLSILLEQVMLEHPVEISRALFPDLSKRQAKEARPTIEWRFQGKRQKRQADLAVLGPDGTLLGVAEVKENDQRGEHVAEQTEDYLRLVASMRAQGHPAYLAYVTKHMPEATTLDRLRSEGIEPVYYRDLFAELSRTLLIANGTRPVARLFCDYLKEEGVVYQRPDDMQAIKLFFARCMTPGRTGLGRLASAERMAAIPETLRMLLADAEILGIEFYEAYGKHFGNRFVPTFLIKPSYSSAGVLKKLRDLEDGGEMERDMSLREHLTGGYLYVVSQGSFQTQKNVWLRIWLGFIFKLTVARESKVRLGLYVEIFGSGLGDAFDERYLRSFPDQTRAQEQLRQMTGIVLEETLKGAAPLKLRPPLEDLRKALSGRR